MAEHQDAFRGYVIRVVTREFHHGRFNKTYYDIVSVTITRDGKPIDYTPSTTYENRDEAEVYKVALVQAQQHLNARYSE